MSYQIRHKEFGVFQGECLGMGFWYPMSEQPEQGFCEFPTVKDAQIYIDSMCKEPTYKAEDFSIEPFDGAMSVSLQRLIPLLKNQN